MIKNKSFRKNRLSKKRTIEKVNNNICHFKLKKRFNFLIIYGAFLQLRLMPGKFTSVVAFGTVAKLRDSTGRNEVMEN